MICKRSADSLAAEAKRCRLDEALPVDVQRTSTHMAPVISLQGHEGEIYSCAFHPEGNHLAHSGSDPQIKLWSVYGECENVCILSGHTASVLESDFSADGYSLFTCSVDKTLSVFDLHIGKRVRQLVGHNEVVNSCNSLGHLLVSGSDDNTIKLWDTRTRIPYCTLENGCHAASVCFNKTGDQAITAGTDGIIKVWDIRNNEMVYQLHGHTDTITGLSLSPNGSHILSNSIDNTLRLWDIRPLVKRCVYIFTGHQHNGNQLLRCSWSPDGTHISAGSTDGLLNIWDTSTKNIVHTLPGHSGSVNCVDFHPTESIIVSGSSDLYLSEF